MIEAGDPYPVLLLCVVDLAVLLFTVFSSVLDDSNPRSLAVQLRAIESHLDYLARVSGARVPALPASLDQDLDAAVKQFAGDEQVWRHEGLALALLRDLANETDHQLDALSEAITRAYFSHVPAAQAVGSSTA